MGYIVKEEDSQTGEVTRRGPFVTEAIAKPRTVAASATSAGQRVGSPHSASCGARFARGIRYHAGRGGRDGTV